MSGNETLAKALLDGGRAAPSGLKAWNGSDPTARFNVYRNNVFSSLIEALATTFPVVEALVGVEFFRAMAREFIAQSPPTSRILAEYGGDFPGFIAAFPQAAGLAYLADLARLEHLRVQCFHAADAEAVGAEDFRQLLAAPDQLSGSRVQLHPALRLLRSDFAVFSLWAAHQGHIAIEAVDWQRPQDVMVLRPAHDVRVLALPPGGAVFLGVLAKQGTLAEAAATASEEAGFDLAANLRGLIDHGLVTRLRSN